LVRADPRNFWIRPDLADVDWSSYLNVLFWNLNYWDTASTLAGEVADPRKTFPRGLLYTSVLVFASYLLPLVAGVGMLGDGGLGDWRKWTSGTLALVGEQTGGPVMKAWVVGAAAVSNVGQFISEQVSSAYQLQGMAELGWLPACFGQRSRHGTPSAGLALGLVVILLLGLTEFLFIIDLLNGVYCIAQLLEFAAFLKLRRDHGSLHRPFRVPLQSTWSCGALLLAPAVFCCVMLAIPVFTRNWLQVSLVAASPVAGALLYLLLGLCRRRGWATFTREPPATVQELLALQTPAQTPKLSAKPPPPGASLDGLGDLLGPMARQSSRGGDSCEGEPACCRS